DASAHEKPVTTRNKPAGMNRNLKSKRNAISLLLTKKVRKICHKNSTKGIPVSIPSKEDEQLKIRTSWNIPGDRRRREATRAMRIPSCFSFLRKNRLEA